MFRRFALVPVVLVLLAVFAAPGCAPVDNKPYSADKAYQRALSAIGSREFNSPYSFAAWAYNLPQPQGPQDLLDYFIDAGQDDLCPGDLVVYLDQFAPFGQNFLVGLYGETQENTIQNISVSQGVVAPIGANVITSPGIENSQYIFFVGCKIK